MIRMYECHIRQALPNMLFMNKLHGRDKKVENKNIKNKTVSYTIERKFLAKLSVTELISRIAESHIRSEAVKEDGSGEKEIILQRG